MKDQLLFVYNLISIVLRNPLETLFKGAKRSLVFKKKQCEDFY